MSYLYVSDQSAVISYSANRFQVKYKDGMLKSIPAEMLEVIEVFGNVQITTQCLRECLQRGINIIYYSTKGAYFGRVISPGHSRDRSSRRSVSERCTEQTMEICVTGRLRENRTQSFML